MIPPALPGHSHDLALPFDLDRARTLLAEAGFPDGRGLPELRLLHADLDFDEKFRRDHEARWQQWHELGVRIRHQWQTKAGADSFDYGLFADADLIEWAWDADYPDPDGMLGTLLKTMPIRRDAKIERLITRACSLRSKDERLGLYPQADRQLVTEHAWLVPTNYEVQHVAHRPWLEGFWGSSAAISPLNEIVVRDR